MLLSESHQKLVWHPRYPPKTDTYSSDLLWVPAGQNIQWGQIPLEILEQRGETAMVDSGNWKKRLPISNCKWMTKTDYLNLISSSKETQHWITLNGDLMQKNLFNRTLEHKQYVQLKLWTWKLHHKSHFLIRMYGSYLWIVQSIKKHCQRHNGPETRTNLDQISSS